MDHAVGVCQNEEDAYLEFSNVLLEFQVAIHRHQYFEIRLRTVQKFAVFDALPAKAGNSGNLVTRQLCG